MASRAQWLTVGGILGLLVAAVIVGMTLTPELKPIRPGSKAPEFSAIDVVTLDTVTLADYSGEVVLLNIWATWCEPCEVEMPSIQRLHEQLVGRGLEILAVSVDVERTQKVRQWAGDRNLTFRIAQDRSGRIGRTYQTTAVPESFIIDREGIIIKKYIGPDEWDKPTNVTLFARLLGTDSTGVGSKDSSVATR